MTLPKNRAIQALYRNLIRRCQSKGFEEVSEDLFAEWISDGGKLRGRCAFTGLFSNRILRDRGNKDEPFAFIQGVLSADRIDNTVGYTDSNVQGVLQPINLMRGSLEPSDFIKLCCYVSEHTKLTNPELFSSILSKYHKHLEKLDPSDYKEEDVEEFLRRNKERMAKTTIVTFINREDSSKYFSIFFEEESKTYTIRRYGYSSSSYDYNKFSTLKLEEAVDKVVVSALELHADYITEQTNDATEIFKRIFTKRKPLVVSVEALLELVELDF